MNRLYGIWTVSSSLIRNLDLSFWFGTPRVIEENKPQNPNQKREVRKAGQNREKETRNLTWDQGGETGGDQPLLR